MIQLIHTPDEFAAMLEGSKTKLAVVDFFAEWCVVSVCVCVCVVCVCVCVCVAVQCAWYSEYKNELTNSFFFRDYSL